MMELTYLNNMFSQNNSGTIYIFFRIKGWNYCTFACCSLQRMGGVAFFHKKHRWVYNFFFEAHGFICQDFVWIWNYEHCEG
jgi:hypothetical protein